MGIPIRMKTNEMRYSFRWLSLIYLLFFMISAFGQKNNIILNIIDEFGDRVPSARISFKSKNDSSSKSMMIKINDPIDSEATIHVIDDDITVVLKSYNGTTVEIPGTNIVTYQITNENEKYQLIKSESPKQVIINKLKEYLGSVVATGPTERLQALTSGTIFALSLEGNDLNVALKHGKLNLDHLIKREVKDDNVIGNDNKRALFIRKNKLLTVKDGTYPAPDSDFNDQPLLTGDREIKKFLSKPFNDQKRTLLNKGEFSKKAFKNLENDPSTEKALPSFEKAIENGELTIDLVVQSAFLFADYYLYNDKIEKSRTWLDVGIHFGKIFYDSKQEILNNNLKHENMENKEIEKAITNVLRYNMITANEFTAWGYDIKLKLNSCLETSNENPSKYRSNANELSKAIEKDNQ